MTCGDSLERRGKERKADVPGKRRCGNGNGEERVMVSGAGLGLGKTNVDDDSVLKHGRMGKTLQDVLDPRGWGKMIGRKDSGQDGANSHLSHADTYQETDRNEAEDMK